MKVFRIAIADATKWGIYIRIFFSFKKSGIMYRAQRLIILWEIPLRKIQIRVMRSASRMQGSPMVLLIKRRW